MVVSCSSEPSSCSLECGEPTFSCVLKPFSPPGTDTKLQSCHRLKFTLKLEHSNKIYRSFVNNNNSFIIPKYPKYLCHCYLVTNSAQPVKLSSSGLAVKTLEKDAFSGGVASVSVADTLKSSHFQPPSTGEPIARPLRPSTFGEPAPGYSHRGVLGCACRLFQKSQRGPGFRLALSLPTYKPRASLSQERSPTKQSKAASKRP